MANKSGYGASLTVGSYTGAELTEVGVAMDNEAIDVADLADYIAQVDVGQTTVVVTGRANYNATVHFLSMVVSASSSAASVGVTITDPAGSVVLSGAGFVTRGTWTAPKGGAINQEVAVRINTLSVP